MMLILALLTFVVLFGASYVVNLIVHRWWPNLAIYLIVIAVLIAQHRGIAPVYWIPLLVGTCSVLLASWSFRSLRDQGYQLFRGGR